MSHRSRFDLITRGGVTAGEEWICDGDEPIARLEQVLVEQPEQNLRYFDRNLKPVVLRDLRLAPGGRPLVAGVQMFWNLDGHIITRELVDVSVEGRGSERLVVTVVTADAGGVATSRRVLTLTYDEALDSYVYDFACHLELASPETIDRPGVARVGFEYSDPWYCDVPAPTVAFPGAWSDHGYTHLLAEPADGPVWQMPLNHLATGIPAPQSLADGGLFVLADDAGNNPAFEFIGDTAARTSIGVCNWGYDIHFRGNYDREELYRPICERFRVRLCPDDKVAALRAAAPPPPTITYGAGFAELPVYERHSSFARGMKLDEPSPGDLDPWPWQPSGAGAEWCHDCGREDDHSLKVTRTDAGVTEWGYEREGVGAWTQRWRAGTGFRVSVWVRTEGLAGRGACLALRWIMYNQPERHAVRCSDAVAGTTDWTRLSVEIEGPPPPEVNAAEILLRLDGVGSAWFDDIDVEVL